MAFISVLAISKMGMFPMFPLSARVVFRELSFVNIVNPLRVEAPPAMVPWHVLVQVVDTWAVRKGWKWWKDGIGWNDLSKSRNGRWYSNLFKDPQQRQCPTFHIQLCMDIRCGISILQLSTFNDLSISVWGGPSSSSFQTFLATSVMHFSLGSFPFAANSGEKVWAAEQKRVKGKR